MLDEVAYHGATQAYLWGVPILANYAWASEQRRLEGPLTFITYDSVDEKRGILTSNMVTPYLLAFPNLRETGPLVIEIPPGATGGIMNDFMMRNITDTGVVGPDGGRGGKYLVLHDSWAEPDGHGADFVVRSKTWNFWAGSRILDTNPDAINRIRAAHRIYPLGNEVETRIVPIATREYRGWQPDGIAYWEMLHEVIQIEDFADEFPLMMQYLARVGIEKGKPFAPDERQQAILLRAEAVGGQMAVALSAGRNLTREPFYDDGSQWSVHLGGLSNAQHTNPQTGMYELDGLVSYTWEAFAMSDGMMQPTIGRGSKYLAAYADSEGRWLNGSYTYRLRLPANVPARQFWLAGSGPPWRLNRPQPLVQEPAHCGRQ